MNRQDICVTCVIRQDRSMTQVTSVTSGNEGDAVERHGTQVLRLCRFCDSIAVHAG